MPTGSLAWQASLAGFGSNGCSQGGVFETVTSFSGVRTKSTSW